ncbi:MAG TPA: YCF48-related protein, partial [Gammaproteobacteria bacterium]|nr:YCF48-related protein [Gammaproteobacteria bacterium]
MLMQSQQEMINYNCPAHLVLNYSSKLLYFALLIILLFFTPPASAAWSTLNSGSNEELLTMDFPVNATTGYVGGRRGVVLKTSNGGSTWQKQSSKTTNSILDIDFIDNQTGYAVGANGTLIKTTDGGTRWVALNAGTTAHLYSVNFPLDANTGYIGGANNTLLKTTNGGQTWTPQFIDGGYVMTIVFPVNDQVGYAST